MIRPSDFDIRFNTEPTGTCVQVTHIPTGNHRSQMVRHSTKVGNVRDALIADLKGALFGPTDVRVDIGRSTGGDFIQVTHLPSGIHRKAMRRERSELDLLDEVLDELYADPNRLKLIQEPPSKTEGN
jgi:hypothetical protein